MTCFIANCFFWQLEIFGKNACFRHFLHFQPGYELNYPSAQSPKAEDNNHTSKILFGNFNWVSTVGACERRNKDPGKGGRVGVNPNEWRRRSRNAREGNKGKHVTRKGPEGGLIIEFLGGFQPITSPPPLPGPWRSKTATTQASSCLELLIGLVQTEPWKEKQRPPNQNPKQEEARRLLSRRRGKGSKTVTRTVTHAKLWGPLKTGQDQQCSWLGQVGYERRKRKTTTKNETCVLVLGLRSNSDVIAGIFETKWVCQLTESVSTRDRHPTSNHLAF